MRTRRAIRPPDLTSLFDVLFLFVFVSLVNAGMSRHAADVAEAKAAPPPPAPSPAMASLRDRAVAQLGARTEVVVRVSAAGAIERIELVGQAAPPSGGAAGPAQVPAGDRTIASDVSLVERVADPDVGLIYRGDRDRDLRVCGVVARALGATDLHGLLIVIAPDAPVGALAHALADGLRADEARCSADTRGVAVVVEAAKGAVP